MGALATNAADKGKDLDTSRFSQLAMGRYVRQPLLKRLPTVPESATRRRTAYGSSGCIGVTVRELAERMVDAAANAFLRLYEGCRFPRSHLSPISVHRSSGTSSTDP